MSTLPILTWLPWQQITKNRLCRFKIFRKCLILISFLFLGDFPSYIFFNFRYDKNMLKISMFSLLGIITMATDYKIALIRLWFSQNASTWLEYLMCVFSLLSFEELRGERQENALNVKILSICTWFPWQPI